MGIDTVIVSKNIKMATTEEFEKVAAFSSRSGGKGIFRLNEPLSESTGGNLYELSDSEFAYHWVLFKENHVIIYDGCRLSASHRYQLELINYLQEITGGIPMLAGDDFFDNTDQLIESFDDPSSDYWISKTDLQDLIEFEQNFLDRWEEIAFHALQIHFYDEEDRLFREGMALAWSTPTTSTSFTAWNWIVIIMACCITIATIGYSESLCGMFWKGWRTDKNGDPNRLEKGAKKY